MRMQDLVGPGRWQLNARGREQLLTRAVCGRVLPEKFLARMKDLPETEPETESDVS